MKISQRGTSSTGNGYVSLDRWYSNQSGGSTTFTQETNTSPSQTGGIKSYARLNVSSSSNYTGINQKIEDVTSVPSGIVTLSFWAKGTVPVGGLYLNCSQDFGTGGSGDVNLSGILITSSLTSSWVKYSTQITIPSVDGKTINAGSFFVFQINQGGNSSSTAYDLNITGVQLEVGSVATEFEHRSYGEELALCQRYFERGFGFNSAGTTYVREHIPFIVTKRSSPSVISSSNTPSGSGNGTAGSYYQAGTNKAGIVSGNVSIYSYRAAISPGFTANQDIFWEYTADAEL
jgi:hypothetical protein